MASASAGLAEQALGDDADKFAAANLAAAKIVARHWGKISGAE